LFLLNFLIHVNTFLSQFLKNKNEQYKYHSHLFKFSLEHTAIVKPWKTTTLDRVLRHQFDINVQTFLCQWVFYLQFSWKNANSKHQRPNPTLFHWLTQYIWLCLPPTLEGHNSHKIQEIKISWQYAQLHMVSLLPTKFHEILFSGHHM
jgi:hypothetical protein